LFRLGALVVLSDGWKRWVVEHIGLPEEQVHVVNNPIERTFERAALEWNEPPGGDVFFVGALGERKGVYDILEAAPSLAQAAPGTRIVLVGPGDREGDLEGIGAKIDSARLRNVEIRGPLYGEEKKELFRTHGIFLFPSHSENFPLVILEAAAAGRAIITTRVGAVPEFFEHDRSVLFVMQKDIAGITGAVVRLVSDRALRADLGREARKVFLARLSRASVMEAMGRTYRAVLASPTGSRGIGRPVRPAGGAENDSPRVYSGGRAGA
jgi:glycosyltransferase involved in cell wall biosynthesis